MASKDKKVEIKPEEFTFDLMVGYPKEDTLLKEVSIREMTGADEEAVAKAEVRSNIGKLITTLLANCVTRLSDGTITLSKASMTPAKWEQVIQGLYLGDRDYILMKLREYTYGSEMHIDSQCPFCRNKLKVDFFMDEIELTPVTSDPARVPFELPKGYRDKEGNTYRIGAMRLLTGIDQEAIDPIARRNPGIANTTLISRSVYELEGLKLSPTVFRELSQKDREYLVETLSEATFGPKFLITVTCDSCGEEFETGVNPVNFI